MRPVPVPEQRPEHPAASVPAATPGTPAPGTPAPRPQPTADAGTAPETAPGTAIEPGCLTIADDTVDIAPAEQPEASSPDGNASACIIEEPAAIGGVKARDGKRSIAIPSRPTLNCAYGRELAKFLREIADPMAIGYFGAGIARVDTGPGFQCRYRNRASGGKVSAHGRGIALDIAGFVLTDGRRIPIGSGGPGETGYVDAIRKAACGQFTTILGPGSDPSHATHLHLDTEKHGRSDNYRICQ
ncbi:MAG: extensin family protein [Flavobacteriaceae bacterium]